MNIAFTGASSFTGAWFVNELVSQGHNVVSLLQSDPDLYTGLKEQRFSLLENSKLKVAGPFGSDSFLNCLRDLSSVDVFCHHAAEVANYKSAEFNSLKALEKNTYRLVEVLKILKEKGCSKVVLTGSVFAPNEGVGRLSEPRHAFSPYGLSKGLTSDYFDYVCLKEGMNLKKFIIPNPFGPFEEIRFTSFVAKNWLKGDKATLTHPEYVRDNVPVTLLAKIYAQFIQNQEEKNNPSFYAGTQEDFTLLFQNEMKKRLFVPCELEIRKQVDFSEPLYRINSDKPDLKIISWNENNFWDDLASFYLKNYGVHNEL